MTAKPSAVSPWSPDPSPDHEAERNPFATPAAAEPIAGTPLRGGLTESFAQRFAKPAPQEPAPLDETAGAVYSLEFPARCPHCERQVRTFRVFRLLRTRVSFTSTLPRKGYAIVCPECACLLSAELAGLV